MTVKKKSSTSTGGRCENASIKQRSKPNSLPRRQDPPKAQGFVPAVSSSAHGSSAVLAEHRTYSNDPAQVRQWAAGTVSGYGPIEDSLNQQSFGPSIGNDTMMSRSDSQVPGSYPMLRSHVASLPVPHASHMFDTGLDTSFSEVTSTPGDPVHGLPTSLIQQPPCLNLDMDLSGGQYQESTWSYPTPTADDMVYSNSAAMPSNIMDPWPQMPCQAGQELTNNGFPCASNSMAWSPLSAVDPSVASSHSQSSFIGQQPDTPLSQAFHDGTWSSDHQGNMDPENSNFQGFNLGEPTQLPPSVEFIDRHHDGLRFVLKAVLCGSRLSNIYSALSSLDGQWKERHFLICGSKMRKPSGH